MDGGYLLSVWIEPGYPAPMLTLLFLMGCPGGGPTIDTGSLEAIPTDSEPSVDDLAFQLFMDLKQSRSEAYEPPEDTELGPMQTALVELFGGARVRNGFLGVGYDLTKIEEDGGTFLVVREIQSRGRASLVYNPDASNDLVVQVPHAGYDTDTWEQGAAIFQTLGARALVINGSHRCANEQPSGCDGTTPACGDPDWYRESDAAHFDANMFQTMTAALDEAYPAALFVQLHGFGWDGSGAVAHVSDGTDTAADTTHVANRFKAHLESSLPEGFRAASCNDAADTDAMLCGTNNVQGRLLNGVADTCSTGATASSQRFLHVEQALDLRREGGESLHRGQVIEALRATLAD